MSARVIQIGKVTQRKTEYFFTHGTAQKLAKNLRNEGWTVSTGFMRAKDGKDFYVRAWRRSKP